MAIDFGDIASRYLNARIDQATQPFTDPEAYFNKRLENRAPSEHQFFGSTPGTLLHRTDRH